MVQSTPSFPLIFFLKNILNTKELTFSIIIRCLVMFMSVVKFSDDILNDLVTAFYNEN
jgi:hypothetical protein